MIRKFKITVTDLVRNETPSHLRKYPSQLAFFRGLLAPFVSQSQAFSAFRDAAVTQARVSSESISLEWYLNERFDTVQRRIAIQTAGPSGVVAGIADTEPTLYFVAGIEGSEPTKYKVIGLKGEDTGFLDNSFLVYVPISLSASGNSIAGVVRQYKLAGKKFLIKYF